MLEFAGLACDTEEPAPERVELSGDVLCAITHAPDSSNKENNVALAFMAVSLLHWMKLVTCALYARLPIRRIRQTP